MVVFGDDIAVFCPCLLGVMLQFCSSSVTHGIVGISLKGMVSAETMLIVFVLQTTPTYSTLTNQNKSNR